MDEVPDNPAYQPLFPRLGVSLAFFEDFIESFCGGAENLRGKTTTDVCNLFVRPFTEYSQLSLCDQLLREEHLGVGTATVFISHAWNYQFLEVVDALKHHFGHNRGRDQLTSTTDTDIFLWFDLFSHNQHLHNFVELDFNGWCTTLQAAIVEMEQVVMVLAPWHDPVPFTRAWCLFELYVTFSVKNRDGNAVNFAIAMSAKEERSFLEAMLPPIDDTQTLFSTNTHSASHIETQLLAILTKIRCEKSDAYYAHDRERIFRLVLSTAGGFEQLNSTVFVHLRQWFVQTLEAHVHQSVLNHETMMQELLLQEGSAEVEESPGAVAIEERDRAIMRLRLLIALLQRKACLAHLYLLQGAHERADHLLEEVVSRASAALPSVLTAPSDEPSACDQDGSDSSDSSGSSADNASKELSQSFTKDKCMPEKKKNDKEPVKEVVVVKPPKVLKDEDEVQKPSKKRLSEDEEDATAEQLPLLHRYLQQSLWQWQRQRLLLTQKLGQVMTAEREYRLLYTTRCATLGPDHVETLHALNFLATSCNQAGKYSEAEEWHLLCLQTRLRLFGAHHMETLWSMNNLALTYRDKGQYREAADYAWRCYEGRCHLLGVDHPLSVSAHFNYAHVLRDLRCLSEALVIYQQCLTTFQMVYGAQHTMTLLCRSNVAVVWMLQIRRRVEQLPIQPDLSARSEHRVDHPRPEDDAWSIDEQLHQTESWQREALLGMETYLNPSNSTSIKSASRNPMQRSPFVDVGEEEEKNEEEEGIAEHPFTLAAVYALVQVLWFKYQRLRQQLLLSSRESKKKTAADDEEDEETLPLAEIVQKDEESPRSIETSFSAEQCHVYPDDHVDGEIITLPPPVSASALSDHDDVDAAALQLSLVWNEVNHLARRCWRGRRHVLGVMHPHTIQAHQLYREITTTCHP